MLHDTKTVNGSNFDQDTTEKMAPPFVAQLDCRNRGLKRREAGVGKERMSSGEGEGARWEREQGGNIAHICHNRRWCTFLSWCTF